MRKQTLIRISLAFAFASVGAIGNVAWSIYSYDSDSKITQADAAIVLGAAVWGERPSPVFRERINHAVALYHAGRVRKLVFTGGQGDENELAEAVVAQRYAVEHGVPEADILIETRSRTTEQNLYYATNQATGGHDLTRFFIVSDPLHMKRAMQMAHDMGLDAYPSPTPTTRYQSKGSQLRFLVRETYFYLTYSLRRTFNLDTH